MYLGCSLGGAKLEHRCPYPEVNSIQAKHVWTQDLAQVFDFEPWMKFNPSSKSGLKYLNWARKPESIHVYIIKITLIYKTWLCLVYSMSHILYAYNISRAWAWIWRFNFTHMLWLWLWLWLWLIIHMQFGLGLSLVTIHPSLSELHCWSLDPMSISPTMIMSGPKKSRFSNDPNSQRHANGLPTTLLPCQEYWRYFIKFWKYNKRIEKKRE